MALLKSRARFAPDTETVSSRGLYQRLETLLISGGDARLAVSPTAQINAYGASPFPRPHILDFASSTASSISDHAYTAAEQARLRLLEDAAVAGMREAFDNAVERARAALKHQLGIAGAEIVFSPSGTDAQLQALFVAKTLLGKPLVSIVVGSDQTGSGTAYTAHGQHFGGTRKGVAVAGLADGVRSVGIPFCDGHGHVRAIRQMDEAVGAAVDEAISRGEKVLLQIMDASKLGWRAPSLACVDNIMAAHPADVCVVVDACQMRLGRGRLQDHLAKNFLVLMTGSKYFTGPCFSGALLVPARLAKALENVHQIAPGLWDCTTRYDWPRAWPLRAALTDVPNYGQWLRWEASLAEMKAYFSVPAIFREAALETFAAAVPGMIAACRHLRLLETPQGQDGDEEMRHPSIFSFVAERNGQPLTLQESGRLYRALGRDLSGLLPADASKEERQVAARQCQIGQPVALQTGAALRLSCSARLVTSAWARHDTAVELVNVQGVIEKLDWLVGHPEMLGFEAP